MESERLHCVLCNFSCSINSSTERTWTEKPHAPHFDCRKKTSFCTTGFRLKSYSSNSIRHTFGQTNSRRSEANRRALSGNCRNILAKKISPGTFIVSARFQAITRLQPVFLLARAPSLIGSLDTFDLFDLFDSIGTERRKKPLDYVLLSIRSVLVGDLPWRRVQSHDGCAWNRRDDALDIFPFNRETSRSRRVRGAIGEKSSITRLKGRK